jgi:hypothetical protein
LGLVIRQHLLPHKKDSRSAILLALLVISHWLLDVVTHRPDLPLSFSEKTKLGLELWNYKTATIIIEVLLFSIGVWLYITATEAKKKKGIYALWGLVLFFVVIYFMNAFGDPPPDAKIIGYVGLAQWLFILWGYWVDRHITAPTID